MSRWANDPDAAADQLIARCLDGIEIAGRILLANQGGGVPALLADRGLPFTAWNRRLAGSGDAHPWPPAGPFDVALLRLPKAKDEQEMAAHACLGALVSGGRLIVYGGNDEGIRSAGGRIERLCGTVETLAARGHGRVLAALRPVEIAGLRGALADWRTVTTLDVGGVARDWVSYPSVFAAGRIDAGTALLIGALPGLAARASVLDYGCGTGVIAASTRAAEPTLALDLLDSDAVALAAARENVPGARLILGTRLADAGARRYAAILSNPPLHRGIAEDHALLHLLVADAPGMLDPGGVLQMVVQRRVPLDRLLGQHFTDVTVAAENGSYRVWRGAVGSDPPAPTVPRRHRRP